MTTESKKNTPSLIAKPEGKRTYARSKTKKDPTARWTERVKEMSSSIKRRHPVDYHLYEDQYDEHTSEGKVDFQQIATLTKECIQKRPLTSMVIAATAGAAAVALVAALFSNKQRR